MSTRPNLRLVLAAGLLVLAGAAAAQKPHGTPPPAPTAETATIENSGSTNTLGYTVIVSSAGTARVGGGPAMPLPKPLVAQFFADLKAAGPLAALPAGHGMRSASFGTRTELTYHGQRSPDLTFPGDPRGAALKTDITTITGVLHVRNMPRHPVQIPPPATH